MKWSKFYSLQEISFVNILFKYQTVLFDPYIGPYLRASVDLGAMAMKGYSTFPKALEILESHHQIV